MFISHFTFLLVTKYTIVLEFASLEKKTMLPLVTVLYASREVHNMIFQDVRRALFHNILFSHSD